jgi:hypothetical protein
MMRVRNISAKQSQWCELPPKSRDCFFIAFYNAQRSAGAKQARRPGKRPLAKHCYLQ